jgi:hypothetical protein
MFTIFVMLSEPTAIVPLLLQCSFVLAVVDPNRCRDHGVESVGSLYATNLVLNAFLKSFVELCYKGFFVLVYPSYILLEVGGVSVSPSSLLKVHKGALCRSGRVNVSEDFVNLNLEKLKVAKQPVRSVTSLVRPS